MSYGVEGKTEGRTRVDSSKLKQCVSKWCSNRIIPHECLSFLSLQNIPGHSFLPRSHILMPLLGMASSSWHGMNGSSHCPQGRGSVICGCHCRDANESSFEVDCPQCGLALAQANRRVNASPSEINTLLCLSWPSQLHV